MKLALSAGHYPASPGAVYGAVVEHTIAVEWVTYLKPLLEQYGLTVFMVPTGALVAKVGAINAEQCDAAIELHLNSDPAHAGTGCETLYMPGSVESQRFAGEVQSKVALVVPPDRGVKEGWYRMDSPGHADFPGDVEGDEVVDAFLRLTHCPAVIVEPLFIHDPRVLSAGPAVCAALARGIANYLLIHEPA